MCRSLRVPLLVIVSCLGAAAGVHTFQMTMQPPESTANVAHDLDRERPNSTIQAHAESPHATGVVPVWSADYWGECFTGCGDRPVHFRNVTCHDMWSGEEISWHKCDYGARMPATQEECSCEDGCHEIPPGKCPEDLGTPGEPPHPGWREVGCFAWSSYPVDQYEDEALAKFPTYHPEFEMACFRWRGQEPCLGGLPFYKYKTPHVPMNPQHCSAFCLKKGMDVYGVEFGEVCRCGVSAVNKNYWDDRGKSDEASMFMQKPLIFHPNNMPPSAAWPCPMKVYRYAGFYEEEGIPYIYTTHDQANEMYQDSLVMGQPARTFNEEDAPGSGGGAAYIGGNPGNRSKAGERRRHRQRRRANLPHQPHL